MDVATSSLKILSLKMPAEEKSPLETLFILGAAFPACFDLKNRRPLKIGITGDVAAVLAAASNIVITAAELKAAMLYYTSGQGYLKRMRAGAARIDLNGTAAGVVTAEEEKFAMWRLYCREEQRRVKRLKKKEKEKIKRGDGVASLKAAWKARQGVSS
jgi:ProP effector